MNSIDDQLARLFRAARAADAASVMPPPYGLETRVMAAWQEADPFNPWNATLLVRGMLLALLLMVLSLWPLLHQTSSPALDSLQLADATLQAGNNL